MMKMIISENMMNLYNLETIYKMKPINKYGIILRLVEEKDAEFILSLRTNTSLNRYISTTSDNLNDQIDWIRNYKIMELAGLEFYFIAEDLDGKKYGTIRLYDFKKNSFEIGSWLFLPNSPLGMAVKAHFIGMETGYNYLHADFCRLEIRKKNISVLRYIKDFKSTLVNEDDLNYYFILAKEDFLIRRNKLAKFLNS